MKTDVRRFESARSVGLEKSVNYSMDLEESLRLETIGDRLRYVAFRHGWRVMGAFAGYAAKNSTRSRRNASIATENKVIRLRTYHMPKLPSNERRTVAQLCQAWLFVIAALVGHSVRSTIR